MTIQAYWPSLENIENCILSEAERLSDKLLLAVHHPMKLVAMQYGSNDTSVKTQQDLLEQLLEHNHIIPLLGESGSGKSHLVRWLHAVANNHPKAKQEQWHIIRIPKNASLSQVLEIMLRNLEGEVFDSAREQIGKVANSLSHETTTSLLFVHIVEAFREVPAEIHKKHQALESTGKMTNEIGKSFMTEMSFASELQHFFDDPHIKARFSGKESVINNRVARLIEIRSYAELLEDKFELIDEDFKFSSGDEVSNQLGARARRAYAQLQLESDASKRQMAAKMTNKAVERACKLMFNRLFQFSSGSFQDLFKEIRKHLLKKGMTLVVLVEDLAAISAIDDVLIESLLEQDKDDGVQVLCPMKSVIAATDGLESYQSHRSTIWTRGRFEWRLPSDLDVANFPELKFTTDDVVNFCARYINTARYGIGAVEQLIDVKETETTLSAWGMDLDESELKVLNDFGYAQIPSISDSAVMTEIPLFPYNRQAITKLTQKHVFNGNNVRFNPRVVIQEVVLAILRDHRVRFTQNAYPSAWFEGQLSEFRNDETAIHINRQIQNEDMARRLIGFMSLYSDAVTSDACFKQVSRRQAEIFGLDAHLFPNKISLEATGKVIVTSGSGRTVKTAQDGVRSVDNDRKNKTMPERRDEPPQVSPDQKLVTLVDDWFARRSPIGQDLSNSLRKALLQMIERHKGVLDYSLNTSNVWGSKKSLVQAFLTSGKLTLINIPGSRSNPSNTQINAFGEKELSDSLDSLHLKKQMLAILRHAQKNGKNVDVGWAYEQGLDDYAHYMQFAQKWVPFAMKRCVELAKQTAHEPISNHVALANSMGFDVSGTEKALNQLVKTSEQIKDELPSAINEQHKKVFDSWFIEWDTLRVKWLNTMLIGTNNAVHPIDFSSAFRNRDHLTRSTVELGPVIREVKTNSLLLGQYLEGGETKEELRGLLIAMHEGYKNIPAEMVPDYEVSLKTVRDRVKKLTDIVTSGTSKTVLALNNTPDDPVKLLNKISGSELELWVKVLNDWKGIYPKVIKEIQKFNHTNGANQIENYKNVINQRLSIIDKSLEQLEVQHES